MTETLVKKKKKKELMSLFEWEDNRCSFGVRSQCL